MTPTEAAALLRVPEDALLRAARRGGVPCLRIGQEFRFPRSELTEAAVAQVAKAAPAAFRGVPPRDPTTPSHPVRPGAGLSHRASEAAMKRAEDSKQAIRAVEDCATFLADKRRRAAERAPWDNARGWRWVAHHRPELEAIARCHGLAFGELVRASHRRARWKPVDLPGPVAADFSELTEKHSLYDA
jgi:excisionase family DNA binding protein